MSLTSSEAPPVAEAETFRRQGYVVLPALIETPLVEYLWSYVHTKFASLLLTASDPDVPGTPADYGDPAFEGLLEHLRPRVEARSGLKLLPTYSYFRFYKRGDALRRHRDRAACEISVSLNIGQAPPESWPLFVEGASGRFGARLEPGDALLYRGIDLHHWRDPFAGNRAIQVFLHYVDSAGPHAGQKFDGRTSLMRPKQSGVAQTQSTADSRDA